MAAISLQLTTKTLSIKRMQSFEKGVAKLGTAKYLI